MSKMTTKTSTSHNEMHRTYMYFLKSPHTDTKNVYKSRTPSPLSSIFYGMCLCKHASCKRSLCATVTHQHGHHYSDTIRFHAVPPVRPCDTTTPADEGVEKTAVTVDGWAVPRQTLGAHGTAPADPEAQAENIREPCRR